MYGSKCLPRQEETTQLTTQPTICIQARSPWKPKIQTPNLSKFIYKPPGNRKKNTNTEDMEEAHYWQWEPSASSSLSLNPPENNRHRPSTQYALSSSLMVLLKTKMTLKPSLLRPTCATAN